LLDGVLLPPFLGGGGIGRYRETASFEYPTLLALMYA
jgi:hypothetical protein